MTVFAHLGAAEAGVWVGIAAASLLAVTVFGRRARRDAFPSWLVLVAVFGLGFQVLHAAEHVLQVGYWLAHPTDSPWLTPWAAAGRDALAAVTDGQPGTGNELLHLVGNGLFLVGVLATVAVAGSHHGAPAEAIRWLRRARGLQVLHVVEHVSLTVTWAVFGTAHGASTLFGVLQPGTVAASTVRVWFHLVLNVAATAAAVAGVRRLLSAERRMPRSGARPACHGMPVAR